MENKTPLTDKTNIAPAPTKGEGRVAEYIRGELTREPEKQKLTAPQIAKRALIWFAAAMLALTFISRAANEALVAKVTVKGASGGILDQSITGTGVWAAADAQPQHPEFTGLRIAKLFVAAGDTVEPGDALYAYDAASLETMRQTLSDRIAQYELQIKELRLGGGDSAKSAAFALSQAEQDLALAQSRLAAGRQEIADAKRRAYEDALYAYQAQSALRASQLASAQQAVDAAQLLLDPADPDTQQALDEARQALSALSAQWDYTMAEPERALDMAQDEWDRVQSGAYDYGAELSSYSIAVVSAQQALETAQFNYQRSKDNDGDTNANIAYQVDGIEISMKAEQEKYDALTAIMGEEYTVRAAVAGTVTEVNAQAGSLTSEQAIVAISAEELCLSMKLTAEQANTLKAGDTVTLIRDGKPTGDKLALMSIGLPDAQGVCSILCTGDTNAVKTLGAAQDYTIEKVTEKKDIRVPLCALREDGSGGYFVLTVGSRATVLGEQAVAVRVDVILIDHDNINAAVEGGISASDKLIVGSNKDIKAGDRVVIEDE